jgi:2,3-bisphosphoglycerate-independent phosphoglycerate mutase
MKPIVLAILDGWGISPVWGGNAIEMNSPSHFNALWRNYPHLILRSVFGRSDKKLLANSEIGHMMIGSGRDLVSDCQFIDSQISQPEFYNNESLRQAIEFATRYNSNIEIIQMVSEGCIHSSLQHLVALLNFCKRQNFNRVFIHAITDGRDVDEVSAGIYIKKLSDEIDRLKVGKIASVSGRFYAMDRDDHWDRTATYFKAVTGKKYKLKALNAHQAIEQAYQNRVSDEFIEPTIIHENGFPVSFLKNNDAVILSNFSSDRMKQLVMCLGGYKKFGLFDQTLQNIKLFSLLKFHFAEYLTKNIQPILQESKISKTLPEVVSQNFFKQLKIAESEKLAHVTYFLNGGVDEPFKDEDRQIIKSSDVTSFDKDPTMKAKEITDSIIKAVESNRYALITVNYANVDEVAHSGDILATSKAVEEVDKCLARLTKLVDENKITLVITADHGNGESMVSGKIGNPETFHTMNPVPFVFADKRYQKNLSVKDNKIDLLTQIAQTQYSLKDIAPTILEMLNIKKPVEMTGKSLFNALRVKWSSQ